MENKCFAKVIKLNPHVEVKRLIIRPENAKQDSINRKLLDQLNPLSRDEISDRCKQEGELFWNYIFFFQSKKISNEITLKYRDEIREVLKFSGFSIHHDVLTPRFEMVKRIFTLVDVSAILFGEVMRKGLIKEYTNFSR